MLWIELLLIALCSWFFVLVFELILLKKICFSYRSAVKTEKTETFRKKTEKNRKKSETFRKKSEKNGKKLIKFRKN